MDFRGLCESNLNLFQVRVSILQHYTGSNWTFSCRVANLFNLRMQRPYMAEMRTTALPGSPELPITYDMIYY
jgi:hypothetical protein